MLFASSCLTGADAKPGGILSSLPTGARLQPLAESGKASTETTEQTEGRPQRLELRLSADAIAILQRAADICGRSVSDFVVRSALEIAEGTIRKHDIIVLSARDSFAFAEALLEPKVPSEALREAVRLHRHMFGLTEGA